MKPWYKSKTLWFNGITILILALDLAVGNHAITDPRILPWITVAVGVGNAVLRLLTVEPVNVGKGKSNNGHD